MNTADVSQEGLTTGACIPMRHRLLVAFGIGLASMLVCWGLMTRLHVGAWDFNFALRAADDLVHHRDMFRAEYGASRLYPLTVGFFAMPFLWLPRELAGGLFFGISSGILAFGLTRDGYTRLLIFLAYPYWASLVTVQWPPLIAAVGLLPALLPVVLAKPQIGLPVALTHLTRRGVILTVLLFGISLAISPTWPLRWLANTRGYQYFIPMFVIPGPLLLFALARRRDPDSHLLLLTALVPQRWFYDTFILWLIPKSRSEILATVALSWGAGIWRWFVMPHTMTQVGMWTVLCMYLPMLGVVWLRGRFARTGITRAHAPALSPELAEVAPR